MVQYSAGKPPRWRVVFEHKRTGRRYERLSAVVAYSGAVETAARALRLTEGLPKGACRPVSCEPIRATQQPWRVLTPRGWVQMATWEGGANGEGSV